METAPTHAFAYAACYCEENVHLLARDPRVGAPVEERRALFVTNRARSVAVWSQRAGDPVVWDYHVVLLARSGPGGRWEAWDLDTTLGLPVPLERWLGGSFRPGTPERLAPRLRLVSAAEYLARFSSDRSHMLDGRGRPRAPRPPWPPIWQEREGMNLLRFVDLERPFVGAVLGLDELASALEAR